MCACLWLLLQVLQQLGVKAAFDETKADFSKLSPEALCISDVLQSVSKLVQHRYSQQKQSAQAEMAAQVFVRLNIAVCLYLAAGVCGC